jgi:hypothetical protein
MSAGVVVEVSAQDGAAFSCGLRGWVQTAEEKRQWQELVEQVARHAFLSRPATLITVSPMKWSIGHSLPNPRVVRAGAEEYLVNDVSTCSADLLKDIAESEDFRRGLLWVMTPLFGDAALPKTLGSIDVTSEMAPASDSEMLILLDDARRIHWLRPHTDLRALVSDVVTYAGTLQWEVAESTRRTE